LILSIVILFCDKDAAYINNLINNIGLKVHFDEYEIVLIDNCEKVKINIPNYNNLKYFKFGYNARQLLGRKKSIELCTGKFVWFVDADDDICDIYKKDFKYFSDLIVTNFVDANGKSDIPLGHILKKDRSVEKLNLVLWNKWVSLKLCKKVYRMIPNDIIASYNEDTLIVLKLLKYAKRIYGIPDCKYLFNVDRSTSAKKENITTLDLYNLLKGKNEIDKLYIKLFNSKKDINYIKNRECGNCGYLMYLILKSNISDLYDNIKYISNYFDKNTMVNSFKNQILVIQGYDFEKTKILESLRAIYNEELFYKIDYDQHGVPFKIPLDLNNLNTILH
jgi:hypothetical protein